MQKMYRQGDLLLIQVDELGNFCNLKEGKIIIKSSVTGHTHEITDGAVYDNESSWRDRANFYISIPEGGAKLIHEEHKAIPLEEGIYKVIRQREVNGYVKD